MADNKLPEPAMRDDPHVVALVTRASGGGQDAWNELVDRYGALVYTICTRGRLSNSDIEDVGQDGWLYNTRGGEPGA